MAGSLNIKVLNNITDISQGDTASTVVVELQDENRLPVYTLNGLNARINLIDKDGEIQQQMNTFVFDSIVEFNIDATIPIGRYRVEIRVHVEDATYVFPSKVDYVLKINKSANDFYNATIHADGTEVVANIVLEKFAEESGGLINHVDSRDNPHEVTKAQVGLGNVANVEQAPKVEFDDHKDDKDNPHSVTKAQVGLGDVDDVKQASKAEFEAHDSDGDIHVTPAEKSKLAGIEAGAQVNTVDSVNGKEGDVVLTKGDVGLSNVVDVKQASDSEFQSLKTVVEGLQEGEDAGAVLTKLNTHVEDNDNPHNITAAQIGADTPAGAQEKADKALSDANEFSEQQIAGLSETISNHTQDDVRHLTQADREKLDGIGEGGGGGGLEVVEWGLTDLGLPYPYFEDYSEGFVRIYGNSFAVINLIILYESTVPEGSDACYIPFPKVDGEFYYINGLLDTSFDGASFFRALPSLNISGKRNAFKVPEGATSSVFIASGVVPLSKLSI